MALAYREGVALKDMEFVQYHPTGLPGTGILITEATRGEGGYVLNKDGRALPRDARLRRRQPEPGARHELGPRDMISRAIEREVAKGRSVDSRTADRAPRPPPPRRGPHRHQAAVRARAVTMYGGVDPVYEPIPIRPVVHYMMGGVDTDIDGATSHRRASTPRARRRASLNGANRLGSNSLTECLVFGARAGHAAASYAAARERGRRAAARRRPTRCAPRALIGTQRRGEKPSPAPRRDEHDDGDGCGVYREQGVDGRDGATSSRAPGARDRGRALGHEQGLQHRDRRRARAANLLEVAERSPPAATARSRAAPTRARDAPKRDDQNYLYHTLVMRDRDGPASRQEAGHARHLGAGGTEVREEPWRRPKLRRDAVRPRRGARRRAGRATRCRCASPTGRSSTRSTTSRTSSTGRSRTAGRAAWPCAGAAA